MNQRSVCFLIDMSSTRHPPQLIHSNDTVRFGLSDMFDNVRNNLFVDHENVAEVPVSRATIVLNINLSVYKLLQNVYLF